jgi:formylglycine-generating enzyme required for sulfatase activity
MTKKVFINYRRNQNLKDAQLLENVLQRTFGDSGVFLDNSGLDGGENWRRTLATEIDQSAAMAALIGKDWVLASDKGGARRLNDSDDAVRFEIARAISRDIPVLPILIDGASMPGAGEVPHDLLPLLDQHAMLLRSDSFNEDAKRIAERLRVLMAERPRHGLSPVMLGGAVLAALMVGTAAGPIVGMQLGFLQRATDMDLDGTLPSSNRVKGADPERDAAEVSAIDKARKAEADLSRTEAALADAQTARTVLADRLKKAEAERDAARAAEVSAIDKARKAEQARDIARTDLSRMEAALADAQAARTALADRVRKAETERDAAHAAEVSAIDKARKAEQVRDNAPAALVPVGKDNSHRAGVEGRATVPLTAAESSKLRPKDSFKECENCPEMVVVPAGKFTMGTREGDNAGNTDERPQHEVIIPRTFAVGRWTVTFDEWSACASEGGCRSNRSPSDKGWGKGRRPAIELSWNDAQEYVAWLNGKVRGQVYRLLSESEWEYVARANTQTHYFWGDNIGKNLANCHDCGSEWDNKQTAPVGSFAANAFGLYDVHGNVWQWVEDCWNDTYRDKPSDLMASGGAWKNGDCTHRVARGGSWSGNPTHLRAANRGRYLPSDRFDYIGFRIARTLPSPIP